MAQRPFLLKSYNGFLDDVCRETDPFIEHPETRDRFFSGIIKILVHFQRLPIKFN